MDIGEEGDEEEDDLDEEYLHFEEEKEISRKSDAGDLEDEEVMRKL